MYKRQALKRVINYPTRGIGGTTIDKLVVAAKHYGRSMFEVMDKIEQLGSSMNINRGTQTRIKNFVTMIKSFQILNEDSDAFTVAETVAKKTGLLQEIKKDGTPEGIARIENIEELLNGMRDFVEEQKQLADTTGSLAEFLDCLLYTSPSPRD